MATKKNEKGTAKTKDFPHANEPITRKHVKRAKMLLKDVHRFLRYNDDLISEPNKEKISELDQNFQETMGKPETTRKELSTSAENLTKTCEKSVKGYKSSSIRENVESFFVVIVIVMTIRTYFAQPFKIPTGSMQPTLNGVIDYPKGDDFEKPNVFTQVAHKVWYGRTYVKKIAKEDTFIGMRGGRLDLEQKPLLLLLTQTKVKGRNGKTLFSVPGTESRVRGLMRRSPNGDGFYPKGSVIASGYIDTGDQVFVDRFSYHWVRPDRGDVFVFNTRNIRGIQRGVNPREGSQHYIKRLVGVPNDQLDLQAPNLIINGEKPTEFGIQRVMSMEGEYTAGYRGNGSWTLGPEDYWAMGDNSGNSLDSRSWGAVPEENIVGRALFVFMPFGHHFGRIR